MRLSVEGLVSLDLGNGFPIGSSIINFYNEVVHEIRF